MILNLSLTLADDASRQDMFAAFIEAGRQAGNLLEQYGQPAVDGEFVLTPELMPNTVTQAILFRSE